MRVLFYHNSSSSCHPFIIIRYQVHHTVGWKLMEFHFNKSSVNDSAATSYKRSPLEDFSAPTAVSSSCNVPCLLPLVPRKSLDYTSSTLAESKMIASRTLPGRGVFVDDVLSSLWKLDFLSEVETLPQLLSVELPTLTWEFDMMFALSMFILKPTEVVASTKATIS